jgi:hypothetical protein
MDRLLKIGSLQVHLDNVPIDLQQKLAANQVAVSTATAAATKATAQADLAKIEKDILASQASLLAFKAAPAIRGTSAVADTLNKRAR